MAAHEMTNDEVKAFGAKLEQWGESLSPKERALMTEILVRAAETARPEVQGYFTLIELAPMVNETSITQLMGNQSNENQTSHGTTPVETTSWVHMVSLVSTASLLPAVQ